MSQVLPARSAIDERIVLLYVSAQRWADAIAHADATLLARAVPAGKLAVSPTVHVELMVARLRAGDVEGATELAERFETIARGRPELSLLLARARLSVTEVPVPMRARQAGESTLTGPQALGALARALLAMLVVPFRAHPAEARRD